jgi:ribosomal subunit interface protein
MQTTISVRHCEVSTELRERAEAVMTRVANHSPHALESTVVFDVGPDAQLVELRLHVRGGQVLIGQGSAPDHRTALDQAEAKLLRQLDRVTETRRDHRSARRA